MSNQKRLYEAVTVHRHYYEDDRVELYNLKLDMEERNNVAADNPELTTRLHEQLFGYLDAVGAKFPVKDPLYNEAREKEHLERVRTVRLPQLEAQRMKFLSEDFDPGNNWWGSEGN